MNTHTYFLIALGSAAVLQSQDAGQLEQALAKQFTVTTLNSDQSDVESPGTQVELRKGGFMAYSTASPVPYINEINKKGGISQPFMKNLAHGVAGGLRAGETGNTHYPMHVFGAGQKLWIVGLWVHKGDIAFRLYSDPIRGAHYYGELQFPFTKGAIPTPEQAAAAITEILAVRTQSTPPPAPAPTAEPDPPPPPAPPAEVATPGSHSLQNEDVIKMAKAGLDDAVIISSIRTSKSRFDTAPESLIALKESGVSSSVLKAMMDGPGHVKPVSNADGLPSTYGFFLRDGTEYRPLTPTAISVVFGLIMRASGDGIAVDGFSGDPLQVPASAPAQLLVYQQNVDAASIRLSRLEFVRNLHAYEFNMMNTNQQFFENVWGVDYNQVVPVNLWRPRESNIPVRIEPVTERVGMFRLTPERPLPPGRYGVYSGQSIHAYGIIYGAHRGASAGSGYYFEVR